MGMEFLWSQWPQEEAGPEAVKHRRDNVPAIRPIPEPGQTRLKVSAEIDIADAGAGDVDKMGELLDTIIKHAREQLAATGVTTWVTWRVSQAGPPVTVKEHQGKGE